MKMTQKSMSVEEVYQKGIKDLNEELYKAYARISDLHEERETIIKEVQALCKKLSARTNLVAGESLIKLPPLQEPN